MSKTAKCFAQMAITFDEMSISMSVNCDIDIPEGYLEFPEIPEY